MSETIADKDGMIRVPSLADKEVAAYLAHIKQLTRDNAYGAAIAAAQGLIKCLETWGDCHAHDDNFTRRYEGFYGE